MLTKFKKKVQDALSSEARFAHKIGLTPNVVSTIGFMLAFLSAAAYAVYDNQPVRLILGLIFLAASGFCDTLDGALARTFNQVSVFGGFLDSMLDRYADAVVYIGIIIGGLCEPIVGLIALVGSLMVSYSRARAEATGIKMETVGLAERPERIIILAASTLGAVFWVSALNIGIIVLAVLSNFTVMQRGLHVCRKCKNQK